MLPLLWLAVSPNAGVPIDTATVAELHLCFRTLLHHGEAVDMFVIARPADFPVLEFAVPPNTTLVFVPFDAKLVQSTFARAGIMHGVHHSGIGGASKLLLPALFKRQSFIFVDTDIVFLNRASMLMEVFGQMKSHHLIAATKLKGLGFRERINSGLIIFKDVDQVRWTDAVIGALLLNTLNCDPFHWGEYARPVCIRHGTGVSGDQEVFSAIVSATYSLYPLPSHAHKHKLGRFSAVPDNVIALHYKNRDDAILVAEAHLRVDLQV